MLESEKNSAKQPKKSTFEWFRDITLILAIISGAFIYLWATYCKTYFYAISFPYHFFSLPNTFLLPSLISIIVLLNLPILLLCLLVYWIIIWKSPCKGQLQLGLFISNLILSMIIYIPFSCRTQPLLYYLYCYFRQGGLFIIKLVQNMWFYMLIALITLFIFSILISEPNLRKYENFKNKYLKTFQDKFRLYMLIISIIFAINYAAVVLIASNSSETLIHGDPGCYNFTSPDINLSNKTLIFVLVQDGNYYLVEKDGNYKAINNTPKPLRVLRADNLKTATIARI